MQSFTAKSWLFALVLAAAALFAPQRGYSDDRFGHHRPVDRIVVFGDSLSDPGNLYQLCRAGLVPPSPQPNDPDPCNVEAPGYGMVGLDALVGIPSLPYSVGANHLSNGPTWIEQFAKVAGLGWSVRPAMLGSVAGSSNYAVAGARASDFSQSPNVPLSQQVDAFLLRDGGPRNNPDAALVVMQLGGNDIRDVLLEGSSAPIANAIASIRDNIIRLHYAGARRFLVWNVPNLGATPAFRALDSLTPPQPGVPTPSQLATGASIAFNQALHLVLTGLEAALSDIVIVQFNAFQSLQKVQAHPRLYGLRDAEHACISAISQPSQCASPDRNLFWDGIHPTRAGHAIIALLAGKALLREVLDD